MIRAKQLTANERIKTANAWLGSNPVHAVRNGRAYDITFGLRKNHRTTGGEWERALVPGNNRVTLCVTPRIADKPTSVFKYVSDKYAGMEKSPWALADSDKDAWTADRKYGLLTALASKEWLPFEGDTLMAVANKFLANRQNYGMPARSNSFIMFMLRENMQQGAPAYDTKQFKIGGLPMSLNRRHLVIDPLMVKTPLDLISRITGFANEHDLGAVWGEEQRLGLLMFILKEARR